MRRLPLDKGETMKIKSMGWTNPKPTRGSRHSSSAAFLRCALSLMTLILFETGIGLAQQPSTSVAPIFNANSKYVNGVGPGYWPTAGALLTLNLTAGTATCGSPPVLVTYSGGTLPMTASQTNYVFLDPSLNCAPSSNTTGFAAGQIPLAKVVANSTSITAITDARNWFVPQPVGTDSSGKAVTKYLNNFRFADQFPGGSGPAKLDAAFTDFGANPGIVIAAPGMGTGDATAYANPVPVLDLRQTTDVIDGITTDPDRPSAVLLEHQLGELTTRPFSGTVTLSNGSTAVIGVNTHFLTEIGPSDPLVFPIHGGRSIKLNSDGSTAWAQVASVTDDTHATLTVGYPGTGGTGPASYFITQLTFMIHNSVNAGTPNTAAGGESVGLSVISNRNGGSRGLWGANFNTTYYTPASATQAFAIPLEIDLGNYSGVDDAASTATMGLNILSAGPNRPAVGLNINGNKASNGFQRGIVVSTWGETGLLLNGPQDHLRFYTGVAPNSNAQIGGRNAAYTDYIWRINNDGSGSFPATVNFNGGIGSTAALALTSGANGNISLTPNGSGSVFIPGTSGDDRLYFQTGPPASSFNSSNQAFFAGASNDVGCLNEPVTRSVCFLAFAENNVPNTTFTGSYGVVASTADSGTRPIVNAVEGDAYSEGASNVSILAGVSGYAQQGGGGTITNMASLNAVTNFKSAGTVTNNYGLYVEDESGIGTKNYGVYTVGPAPSSFGGAVISGLNTVTFSATPTFDASRGNTQKLTLTGNVTGSTLANAAAGEQINFIICQDGTGGRTFVWPTNIKGGMTIGTTASKCSAQIFVYDGTNAYALSGGMTNM
jgi:hypothetical protein